MTGENAGGGVAHTAAAQQRGQIGAEHVRIIRRFFERLPGFVDHETREAAEAQLAELACELKPEERAPSGRSVGGDARSGRRTIGWRSSPAALPHRRQAADRRDERYPWPARPRSRAVLDAVFAKWAAPGMCDPDENHASTGTLRMSSGYPVAARPDSATTTRSKPRVGRCWRQDSSAATRPAGDHRHLRNPGRAGIRTRACGHRWGQFDTDVGGGPMPQPRITT